MAKSSKQYIVLHNAVGPHVQHAIITEADVAAGDVPRLVANGAIREATAEEIQAAEDRPLTPTAAALQALAGQGAVATGAGAASSPARDPDLATGQPGGAPKGDADKKDEP